jgi:hypothetical protein
MSSSTPANDPAASTVFDRLLRETGMSDTRFAKQVNGRARHHRRIELGLASTTVGHWRRGMKPRDPMVAELAAAEVSALVGYPVLPSDLGWRGEHYGREDLGLNVADTTAQTVRTLAGLTGRDMRRRDMIEDGTPFVASAFAEPVLSSITGEIRSQVVTFLHDRTRAAMRDSPDADLCGALAELTQFGGWLAQDSDRQALAQRYYIQALSLAEHADDAQLAGRVLAAMSDQAARLGYERQSLSMARAAVDRAHRRSTPTVEAMLHDKNAWACAQAKDEAGCVLALNAMERAIERGADADEPAWAAHYNAGDVAECVGHCYLLLDRPEQAAEHLLEARVLQDANRARTRSYAEADLAIAYLRSHSPDLEAALDAGQRAVDYAGPVSSVRVTDKMRELDNAFAPYLGSTDVQEWRTGAAGILRRFPATTRSDLPD